MRKNFKLRLGVNEYCFSLLDNCAINKAKPIRICLSFSLSGNFLLAVDRDDIAHTVNYESLCHYIYHEIKMSNCSSFLGIARETKQAIRGYSPLISGGSVLISMQCHESVTKKFSLI